METNTTQTAQSAILELLQVPESYRDPQWEMEFFDRLLNAKVTLLQDRPALGPDGMAYMMAAVEADSAEPTVRLLEWLDEKGVGLVVNPKDPYPDYVFTWGMIWNFKQNGRFITDAPAASGKGEFELDEGQNLHTLSPPESFLPGYVRVLLREFLQQQEVANPKVMAMLVPGQSQADLCFSLESLGNPKEEEHDGICEALSWFLPPHFSIVLMSEKGFSAFEDL